MDSIKLLQNDFLTSLLGLLIFLQNWKETLFKYTVDTFLNFNFQVSLKLNFYYLKQSVSFRIYIGEHPYQASMKLI